jgi:phosphatidylserine/phosphatidylglycerophosphate/cardiolipin synthase-like enzyme
MAEFLTTSGVTFHLERLIKGAEDRLVLVSPFLKINDRLRQILEEQDRFNIDIRVVYGKNELQPAEINWLRQQSSIRTLYCKNLHAKCFLNESEAIITSMNLYEFSQVNNREMGILITKDDDPVLYEAISDEVRSLMRVSEQIRLGEVEIVPPEPMSKIPVKKSKAKPARTKKAAAKTSKTEGHCIRCATVLPFSVEKPLCDKDYRTWARYEDPDYGEDYCHSCGKKHDTSYAKPLCRPCWTKHAKAAAAT